jgi:hypothetical protein
MSYSAETGKMILANLGCYKLKATPGVKTAHPAGSKTSVIQTLYIASYAHAGIICSCNYIALKPKRQLLSQKGK